MGAIFEKASKQTAGLRVNKTKNTVENAWNGEYFEIGSNHESSSNEKSLVCSFLRIF